MIGAIIGDMVGSIYEFRNYKATGFESFLSPSAHFTDDTIMIISDVYVDGESISNIMITKGYAVPYRLRNEYKDLCE